jgi:hypothetical protein
MPVRLSSDIKAVCDGERVLVPVGRRNCAQDQSAARDAHSGDLQILTRVPVSGGFYGAFKP